MAPLRICPAVRLWCDDRRTTKEGDHTPLCSDIDSPGILTVCSPSPDGVAEDETDLSEQHARATVVQLRKDLRTTRNPEIRAVFVAMIEVIEGFHNTETYDAAAMRRQSVGQARMAMRIARLEASLMLRRRRRVRKAYLQRRARRVAVHRSRHRAARRTARGSPARSDDPSPPSDLARPVRGRT